MIVGVSRDVRVTVRICRPDVCRRNGLATVLYRGESDVMSSFLSMPAVLVAMM